MEWVYFLESGIASVVAHASKGRQIETGIIGHEGFVGSSLLLGDVRCMQNVVMQVPGTGRRISVQRFMTLVGQLPDLRQHSLLFLRAFMIQTAQTAVANGCAQLSERLARCLVMLNDLVEDDVLAITHDYISVMLSVRRPGVSIALKALEKANLIAIKRGLIAIKGRDGLIAKANGLYGATEREYDRLLHWRPPGGARRHG